MRCPLVKNLRVFLYRLLPLLFCVVSCKTEDLKKTVQIEIKSPNTAVSNVSESKASSKTKTELKPPKTVLLTDMPPPRVIEVPEKSGGFYMKKNHREEKRIELELPTKSTPPIFYFIQKFTTNEGLSLDTVHGGTFDKGGNLWIGTDGTGASKFDGQHFTNFTVAAGIPHNIVWRILEDRHGNIWFATDGGGAAKYDGISFTIYTTNEGLASNHLRSILEDRSGNLWFSTYGGGVSKYDGKTFTNYSTTDGLANNKVFGMVEDKRGNLWFATEGGVSKFDGKTFVTLTSADGLASNRVRAILEDSHGNLWFGTTNSGVSKYDGENFTTYTTHEGLSNNSIWHIMEDQREHLWFGTDIGASEFDGKTFTTYSKENGLTDNSIRYILEDKPEGNIWFMTFGEGVAKYSGKFLTNYIVESYVRSIAEDKSGNLWFSTEGFGTFEYDGKTFTNYTLQQGIGDNVIESSFLDKDGNLWFGFQSGGVSKYDGESFTTYTMEQGLPDNWIWSIQQDRAGNFWFATNQNGVSKFDGKSFTNYTTEQGLVHNAVRASLVDKKGNIWFTTDGGGISKYDGNVFTNYGPEEGLQYSHIWSIFEDDAGTIWLGAIKKGAIRFDGSTFFTFGLEEGLPDLAVANLSTTKEKGIAIGTQTGLAVLKGFALLTSSGEPAKISVPAQNNLTNAELRNYKPLFEVYNIKRGYPIKDINGGQNALYLDTRGILWIGTGSTKSSLVRMDYSALNKNGETPNVLINRLKINNEDVIWSDLIGEKSDEPEKTILNGGIFPAHITEEVITLGNPLNSSKIEKMREQFRHLRFSAIKKFTYIPENLELPYSLNDLTVEFGVVEPAWPKDVVLYQYKLEGYDKDWSPPAEHTRATFGHITEGDYNLKIKAQSPFGIWSEPISYPFSVRAPWFRSWWAWILYGISGLLGLYLILLWRTARLRRRQKELMQTVDERTEALIQEKKKSDELLLNVLPAQVAKELKEKGSAQTQSYESVTMLVTGFENFTKVAEILSADELIKEMDYCYRNLEVITGKYNIEKIRTTGDIFMAAGGLPVSNKTHAKDVVSAALEILEFMADYKRDKKEKGKVVFDIRIGIHTGPVIAGIVGSRKFAYDVWGDTVNQALLIESNSEDGKINISETTYLLVKNDFTFTYRGKIAAKDKGVLDMYFVKGRW